MKDTTPPTPPTLDDDNLLDQSFLFLRGTSQVVHVLVRGEWRSGREKGSRRPLSHSLHLRKESE